jgi:hypothetical protein
MVLGFVTAANWSQPGSRSRGCRHCRFLGLGARRPVRTRNEVCRRRRRLQHRARRTRLLLGHRAAATCQRTRSSEPAQKGDCGPRWPRLPDSPDGAVATRRRESASERRPQRASRALSTDARLSIQARASPITAAFVVEGNCGEPLGGPVPSAAFAGGGRLTAGRRGPPGSSFVVLSGRGGQRSAVARLRRQVRPIRLRDADPNRRRDEMSRSHAATRARPSLRVRRTHAPPARRPRSRRTRRARQASRRRVAAAAIGWVLRAIHHSARGPPPVRRCRGVGE